MISQLRPHIAAIGAGLVVTVLLIALLAARSAADRSQTLSEATLAGQSAMIRTVQGVLDTLDTLAGQAERATVAGFGTSPMTNLDTSSFRRSSQALLAETPGVVATAYFQRVDLKNIAEAMSTRNAEGLTRFSRPGVALFLPVRVLETGDRANGLLNQGRLPFDLAAGDDVQDALRRAIDTDGITVTPALRRTEDGGFAAMQTVMAGGPAAAVWLFKPVFAAGADTRSRVDALAGIAGILLDSAAITPARKNAVTALSGPSKVPAGWVDIERGGLFSSDAGLARAAVPVGDRAWTLNIAPESRGFLGAGLLGVAFALLAGGAAGFGVAHASGDDRGAAELYRQKFEAQQRDFKRRTRQLKSSEERFRRLAESTNVIPWAADLRENRFTYIGPQIEKISGYPPQSWYSSGYFFDHIHPSDRQAMIVDVTRGIKPGEYVTREYRTRSAGGTVLHLSNMFTVLPPRKDRPDELLAQGFMLDMTEVKTAQEALKRARAAAEEADHTKSEFLANMSHELRTPLNAVVGFAEIMKDELLGPLDPRYRDYAVSIHDSGRHLLELINDVLDLSKIESGRIELIEEETDIGAMLASCRTLLHEKASSAGLHIRLEIPGALPAVIADGRRLKQIVLNLMSNSVKFTRPGGRLTLRAEVREPKGVRIAISDTGVGMSPEEVEVAMSQFGQIDNDLSRHHDGTGLGLPIAKSLAELHGGSLDIESARGAGTTVEIWLPLSRIVHASARQSA